MISKVKTIDGDEVIEAFTTSEVKLQKASFSKMMRNKRTYLYCDEYAVLDTETSHIELDEGWIYQWAFKFNDQYIYGRKPSEFIQLLEKLRDHYHLTNFKKMIIYIHNASYDIQYLKRYLKEYDPDIKIMAMDAHSILIVDILGFRFLCSYKLSNMSLDLFSKTYANKYRKAIGEINYNIIRYQDTELTDTDWYYMFSDVASQHEALKGYLEVNGYDKAYKAPFTSTGFVRTEARHSSEKDRKWHEQFTISALDVEQYNLMHQAFMGGVTIQSYQYSGEVLENVGHKDFTSSYPARQMMNYLPVGKPFWYGEIESRAEFKSLLKEYCCVFIMNVEKLQIKSGITAPYIPSSKCIWLKDDLKVNGKVVFAEELAIAVTELDFAIIERQYNFKNLKVTHMLLMKRGKAPEWLKETVMKYYRNKCELKHSDPRLYMASKAKLNAIYGMSATSIVRNEYEVNEDMILEIGRHADDPDEQQKQIDKFYKSYNSFMPYQFGVYTTAWARTALYDMIEAVGYDNFIYCDTDSVFYINNKKSEARLKKMNEKIRKAALASGAYVGDNFLGVATDEKPIKRFKGLHAKCYAMEEVEKDGSITLSVTIAGIPKRSTKWINGEKVEMTNAEELGKLENLNDGFIFRHCGGNRVVYIERESDVIDINGHMTEVSSSAIIESIEKEISDTMFTIGKNYELLNIKCEQVLDY